MNVSSITGLVASAQAHAYSAIKWAVRGISKSAAVELGPSGIRVNSVHPGFIDTQMLNEFGLLRDMRVDTVPLGRIADAAEVARLVFTSPPMMQPTVWVTSLWLMAPCAVKSHGLKGWHWLWLFSS